MLNGAVLEEASKVADVATSALSTIVNNSILGALLVVAVCAIGLLIKRLLAVQDLRVADQVRANEIMERNREKSATLMEQYTKASNEVNSAVERFTDVQGDTLRTIGSLQTAIASLQSTLDSVIRDAVRGNRPRDPAPSESTGRHEAHRPGAYTGVTPREEGTRR